jgi:hypothetical protein
VDTSAVQGVTILDSAIKDQTAAGDHVVVFGYSQGVAVASQEEAQLAASSNRPSSDQLSFILVGDPSNPNGGINQRFAVPGAPFSFPSLGQTFNLAPAASNTYPTAVYTQEYDGFADFPQYPINLLADLNAYVGIFTQHFAYADLTPQQINSAIVLPTVGDTTTTYYMIPTANLPLLVPVRLIPLIGNPLADLLQPDLRVLVNLGYGSITNGWSPGPANVPTPFGLFPTNINPVDVLTALAKGIPQGITNALNDLKTPTLFDTSSLSGFLAGFHTFGFTPSNSPSLLQLLAGFTAFGNGGVPISTTGGIANTLTNVVAQDIAVVKPFADTAFALGVSLPQYDAELFASQLAAGNLLNAVGMPIAADVALAPYALIVGAAFPIVGAAATTVTQLAELTGVEPNPTPAAAPATTANTKPAPSTANTNPVATTNAQPDLSASTGTNAANAAKSLQSVVNTAVPSVQTPVHSAVSSVITRVRSAVSSVTTALTGGTKPVSAAVSKPSTPAVANSGPTVKPAAGHWKPAAAHWKKD